jgi:hypothetical protein
MPTLIPESRRAAQYRDRDGVITYPKAEDTVETYTIDWTEQIDSGDSIASSSWDVDGVTASGAGTSGTTVYVTISDTNGEITNTTTTTNGLVLWERLRFVGF